MEDNLIERYKKFTEQYSKKYFKSFSKESSYFYYVLKTDRSSSLGFTVKGVLFHWFVNSYMKGFTESVFNLVPMKNWEEITEKEFYESYDKGKLFIFNSKLEDIIKTNESSSN